DVGIDVGDFDVGADASENDRHAVNLRAAAAKQRVAGFHLEHLCPGVQERLSAGRGIGEIETAGVTFVVVGAAGDGEQGAFSRALGQRDVHTAVVQIQDCGKERRGGAD